MKTTRRLDTESENAMHTDAPSTDAGGAAYEHLLTDPQAVIAQADPRDLIGELDGTLLHLTWRWPDSPAIQFSIVVWRADRWPDSPDEYDAHQERVARRTYDAHGFFNVDVSPDLPRAYVRIYAALLEARPSGFESWLYSPGLEPSTRKLVLRTVAVLSRFLRRHGRVPPAIELYTVDGSPLPKLVVVRNKDLPLRVSEGIEIARYSGGLSSWMLVLAESERWPAGSWISVFSSVDGLFWRAERCAHKFDYQG